MPVWKNPLANCAKRKEDSSVYLLAYKMECSFQESLRPESQLNESKLGRLPPQSWMFYSIQLRSAGRASPEEKPRLLCRPWIYSWDHCRTRLWGLATFPEHLQTSRLISKNYCTFWISIPCMTSFRHKFNRRSHRFGDQQEAWHVQKHYGLMRVHFISSLRTEQRFQHKWRNRKQLRGLSVADLLCFRHLN